jgi:glycerol uptake facilitator-like aquaporin
VTGGAVNPARALGPMIVAGKLTSFWVYIVGPLVGGVIAAFAYDRFIGEADAPEE